MRASFVDLRKKSNQIIQALSRNETVTVFYRGKPAAVMQSVHGDVKKVQTVKAKDHEAFGLWADQDESGDVNQQVRVLRKGRLNAL